MSGRSFSANAAPLWLPGSKGASEEGVPVPQHGGRWEEGVEWAVYLLCWWPMELVGWVSILFPA